MYPKVKDRCPALSGGVFGHTGGQSRRMVELFACAGSEGFFIALYGLSVPAHLMEGSAFIVPGICIAGIVYESLVILGHNPRIELLFRSHRLILRNGGISGTGAQGSICSRT